MNTFQAEFTRGGKVFSIHRDFWPEEWGDFDNIIQQQLQFDESPKIARLAEFNQIELRGDELSADEKAERLSLQGQFRVENLRKGYDEYMTRAAAEYGKVFVGTWTANCSTVVGKYFTTGVCEMGDIRMLKDTEAAAIHEYCKWHGDIPDPLFMATYSAYRRLMKPRGSNPVEELYKQAIETYTRQNLHNGTSTMQDILAKSKHNFLDRTTVDAAMKVVLPKFEEALRAGHIDFEPPTDQTPVKCRLAYPPYDTVFEVTKQAPNKYTVVVGKISEKTRIIVVEPIEALVDGTAPQKIAKRLSHIDNHYGTFPPCEWLKKIAYLYGMEGFDGFFRGLTRQQENAAMLKLGSTQTTPSGLVFMPKIAISGLILLGAPGSTTQPIMPPVPARRCCLKTA